MWWMTPSLLSRLEKEESKGGIACILPKCHHTGQEEIALSCAVGREVNLDISTSFFTDRVGRQWHSYPGQRWGPHPWWDLKAMWMEHLGIRDQWWPWQHWGMLSANWDSVLSEVLPKPQEWQFGGCALTMDLEAVEQLGRARGVGSQAPVEAGVGHLRALDAQHLSPVTQCAPILGPWHSCRGERGQITDSPDKCGTTELSRWPPQLSCTRQHLTVNGSVTRD